VLYLYHVQIDGYVYVEYNLGLTVHRIAETFQKVDDGNYHVIRFARHGANSTLKVDDLPLQTRSPPGNNLYPIPLSQSTSVLPDLQIISWNLEAVLL